MPWPTVKPLACTAIKSYLALLTGSSTTRVFKDGASAACDAALLTLSLCTIPDGTQAPAELRRVLKPGGRLHFFGHGHAPDPRIANWQRRIEPVHKKLSGGCRLTLTITELVLAAGFDIDWVEEAHGRGPKPWSFFHLGPAISR